MGKYSFVQVRVDERLKKHALNVLDSIGLDMPVAIRMFLKRIVLVGGIPFDTRLPDNTQLPVPKYPDGHSHMVSVDENEEPDAGQQEA